MCLQTYNKRNTTPRFTHGESQLCTKKSSTYESVMGATVDALQACITDYELKMNQDSILEEYQQYQTVLDGLEAELDKQEKRRKRLFDAFEDGAYTQDEFIERKQAQAKTIEEIKKQIQESKSNAPVPVNYPQKNIQLRKLLETLCDPETDAKAKNRFLKEIVEKIDYDVIDKGRNKGSQPILDIYLK